MKTTRTVLISAIMALALGVSASCALVRVPKDTIVKLSFCDPISTRTAEEGQKVNLRVADDVYIGTKPVILKGEPTVATITRVDRPKNWGRSGRIELEFGSVNAVDGAKVELGVWNKDRQEGMGYAAGASVGGAVVLGPVGLVGGLFVKGKHVDIPSGHEILAAVRWDISVEPDARPVEPATASVEKPASSAAAPAAAVTTAAPEAAPAPAATPAAAPVAKPAETAAPSAAPAVKAAAPAAKSGDKTPAAAKPSAPASKPEPKSTEKPKAGTGTVKPVIPIIEDVTPSKNKK